jgi:hypothetical protein
MSGDPRGEDREDAPKDLEHQGQLQRIRLRLNPADDDLPLPHAIALHAEDEKQRELPKVRS